MTISVNIHEAKAQLSHLLHLMEQGEKVQICRRNIPIAEMVPVQKPLKKKRQFGQYKGQFTVPDSFFEPMSEDELSLWYDGPIFPDE